MEILDLEGRATVAVRALAGRRARLDGGVLGLLDNSKPNARVLLARVGESLRERLGLREVRVWRKPNSSQGAAAAMLDEIAAACGAVLTASAD